MSNEYKDWLHDNNQELCMKYPFLELRNFRGQKLGYDKTWLDYFPSGWLAAFGDDFLNEMLESFNLFSDDEKEECYIVQLKEKYGALRVYMNWYNDKMIDVLHKYERLSENYCIDCGAPATKTTKGYILHFCDKCYEKFENSSKIRYNIYIK